MWLEQVNVSHTFVWFYVQMLISSRNNYTKLVGTSRRRDQPCLCHLRGVVFLFNRWNQFYMSKYMLKDWRNFDTIWFEQGAFSLSSKSYRSNRVFRVCLTDPIYSSTNTILNTPENTTPFPCFCTHNKYSTNSVASYRVKPLQLIFLQLVLISPFSPVGGLMLPIFTIALAKSPKNLVEFLAYKLTREPTKLDPLR